MRTGFKLDVHRLRQQKNSFQLHSGFNLMQVGARPQEIETKNIEWTWASPFKIRIEDGSARSKHVSVGERQSLIRALHTADKYREHERINPISSIFSTSQWTKRN
jgi:hypothetical protein